MPTRLFLLATLLMVTVLALTAIAQAPQTAPAQAQLSAASPHSGHAHPAPTNLKVLPKNLSGEEVHEIMEEWEAALGVHCDACHKPNPNDLAPNGRPRLDFADDSKPEKAIARQMFTMTEEINRNYVSKIDSSGAPVTCGTCHRGHLGPQPFVKPQEEPHAPPPMPSQPQ
jgi:cytochrome c553